MSERLHAGQHKHVTNLSRGAIFYTLFDAAHFTVLAANGKAGIVRLLFKGQLYIGKFKSSWLSSLRLPLF
jgi:hypothetical protein